MTMTTHFPQSVPTQPTLHPLHLEHNIPPHHHPNGLRGTNKLTILLQLLVACYVRLPLLSLSLSGRSLSLTLSRSLSFLLSLFKSSLSLLLYRSLSLCSLLSRPPLSLSPAVRSRSLSLSRSWSRSRSRSRSLLLSFSLDGLLLRLRVLVRFNDALESLLSSRLSFLSTNPLSTKPHHHLQLNRTNYLIGLHLDPSSVKEALDRHNNMYFSYMVPFLASCVKSGPLYNQLVHSIHFFNWFNGLK